jgi:rod shape determining protein RodA
LRKQKSIFENIDWVLVGLYMILVLMGWINIYAAVYNEEHKNIFDMTQSYGRQMLWIGTSLLIGLSILVIEGKFYAALLLSHLSYCHIYSTGCIGDCA